MSAPKMLDVDVPKVGLYSHAAEVSASSRLLFMGGRAGLGPDGKAVADDVAAQCVQAFRNMGKVLAGANMDYSNIVQLTTYLSSQDDVKEFYEARAALYHEIYPDGIYPPNTLLIVQRLVEPELRIEITGIAAG